MGKTLKGKTLFILFGYFSELRKGCHIFWRYPTEWHQRITPINPSTLSLLKQKQQRQQQNDPNLFPVNLPTNCLGVFDDFVGLALKGLRNS